MRRQSSGSLEFGSPGPPPEHLGTPENIATIRRSKTRVLNGKEGLLIVRHGSQHMIFLVVVNLIKLRFREVRLGLEK